MSCKYLPKHPAWKYNSKHICCLLDFPLPTPSIEATMQINQYHRLKMANLLCSLTGPLLTFNLLRDGARATDEAAAAAATRILQRRR